MHWHHSVHWAAVFALVGVAVEEISSEVPSPKSKDQSMIEQNESTGGATKTHGKNRKHMNSNKQCKNKISFYGVQKTEKKNHLL